MAYGSVSASHPARPSNACPSPALELVQLQDTDLMDVVSRFGMERVAKEICLKWRVRGAPVGGMRVCLCSAKGDGRLWRSD